jgi:hypothetical protein
MSSSTVDWSNAIKKEARGSNDEDVEEIREIAAKLCSSIEKNNKQTEILRSNRHRRKL